MRSLLVALALVACTLAYKDEMLSSNRIPERAQEAFGDTCGECKSIIHSFVEAIDDPEKLAKLKMLLNALCLTTGHEVECKLLVNELEFIIRKLEPYLRDEEAICKKLHLCNNPKLIKSAMDRVDGKDSTNDFACDECQMAAIEFKKFVDDVNERAAIKTFLSEKICKLIPKYSGECNLLLDEFLPEFWQLLDALLANPKQACAEIGFCPKQANLPFNKLAAFYKGLKSI